MPCSPTPARRPASARAPRTSRPSSGRACAKPLCAAIEAAPMILPAVALGDHLPRGGVVAEEDAAQVDRHQPVEVLRRDVEQRRDLRDAGVGDHDVEASRARPRRPRPSVDLPGVATSTSRRERCRLADLRDRLASRIEGRSAIATSSPSAASRRAMPRPMPRAPPVTSATRPSADVGACPSKPSASSASMSRPAGVRVILGVDLLAELAVGPLGGVVVPRARSARRPSSSGPARHLPSACRNPSSSRLTSPAASMCGEWPASVEHFDLAPAPAPPRRGRPG